MTPTVHGLDSVERFFSAISFKNDAYQNNVLRFIALKSDTRFEIRQARLFMYNVVPVHPFTSFRSDNIIAGTYRCDELGVGARDLYDLFVAGCINIKGDLFSFPINEINGYLASYDPFHPAGLHERSRFDVLRVLGKRYEQIASYIAYDWELKAADTPYDSIHELVNDHSLAPITESAIFEIIAHPAVVIDNSSIVSNGVVKPVLSLAKGLSTGNARLGYRMFVGGGVVARRVITGDQFDWNESDNAFVGRIEFDSPPTAIFDCIASYDGVAQHHLWIQDPSTTQNARKIAFGVIDSGFQIIGEYLGRKSTDKKPARDFEYGIAWLLWILGFSVAHLGANSRSQEAIDIIATTPIGHFVVVECTIGLLKSESKLANLIGRAESIRNGLEASGEKFLRVLPVIVTSKSRMEIRAELLDAERLNVLVITREHIDHWYNVRTLFPTNPDQLYFEAEKTVRDAAAKFTIQSLPTS